MKTTLFTAGLLSVLLTHNMCNAHVKSPLDVFDLPEAERNMTLTYCERTRHYPASHEAMYPSELLKISEDDEPDYEAHTLNKPFSDNARKLAALLDERDACDQVGVRFVAKFLAYFWPGTEMGELYKKTPGEVVKIILQDLPGEVPDPFFQKARVEARDMVAARYPQD